ncbi:MAG: apolipoprotein N-acyltransferase [Planctomycetota bacterium]|nr:apolipoprotein N-acyltransferase [Planctomycetota bacterium]
MSLWIACLLSAAGGVLAGLPFVELAQFPIWFGLAPAFYAVAAARTWKGAALAAASFVLPWTLLGCWFIATQLAFGALAAALYTGLYYVPALLAVRALALRGTAGAVFGTAAVWALVEIARSRMPVLGWPWLLLGHAVADAEFLRQAADLGGVYGLSFLVAAFNAALAFVAPAFVTARLQGPPGSPLQRRACAAAVLGLLLAALVYGRARVAQLEGRLETDGPALALLQGCTYQKIERPYAEERRQLDEHIALHRKAVEEAPAGEKPALVCWAETMVPGVYNRDNHRIEFRAAVMRYGVPTVFGSDFINEADLALEDPWAQRWHNTAFLMDAGGELKARYFKRRLVPFGEYIPWTGTFPILKRLRSVTRDTYTRGERDSEIFEAGGARFAFNLCVEDAHPDLARRAAEDGAEALLNLTNDAWFRGSSGEWAHLRAARLRSVEVRRPLIRVTNSGVSVQVDPLGRLEIPVPPHEVGIGRLRLKRLDRPPHTWAMVLGEAWVALLLGAVLGAALFLDRSASAKT